MSSSGVGSSAAPQNYMSSIRAQMTSMVSRVKKTKSASTAVAKRAQARSASQKKKAAEIASASRRRAIQMDPKMMRRRGMAKVRAYPPDPLPILKHVLNLWA